MKNNKNKNEQHQNKEVLSDNVIQKYGYQAMRQHVLQTNTLYACDLFYLFASVQRGRAAATGAPNERPHERRKCTWPECGGDKQSIKNTIDTKDKEGKIIHEYIFIFHEFNYFHVQLNSMFLSLTYLCRSEIGRSDNGGCLCGQ